MEGLLLLLLVPLLVLGGVMVVRRPPPSRAARVLTVVLAVALLVAVTAGSAVLAALSGCDAFAGPCEPGERTSSDASSTVILVGLGVTAVVAAVGAWWIAARPGEHEDDEPTRPLP